MGHTPEVWCCRQPLLRARKPVPGKRITHQKAAHTITTQTPMSPNGSPLQVSCENKGQERIGVGRSKENGMSSAVTSAAEKPHGAVHSLVQFSELSHSCVSKVETAALEYFVALVRMKQ